jgi:hypothetical protein
MRKKIKKTYRPARRRFISPKAGTKQKRKSWNLSLMKRNHLRSCFTQEVRKS